MPRPLGIKNRKLKKRKIESPAVPIKEEEKDVFFDENNDESEEEKGLDDGGEEANFEDEMKAEEAIDSIPGLPIVKPVGGAKQPKVIFVLDKASLEVGKVGKTFQILSSEDHANYLRKQNKNPADYRPDIIYHALLSIFDSPLTKAGRLEAVYVRTQKGVLFEVKPHVRVPRTPKRFFGLMSQLLQKLSITATGKREKLLNVIKNPVSRYLPVNCKKIGLSYSSEKLVDINKYVAAQSNETTLVFLVGAMAHGVVEKDTIEIEDFISICDYPLSAACCLSRICGALEQKWRIPNVPS